MKKLADKLADFIVQEGAVPEQAYAVYQYGFQIGLEMLLCFLICLIISIYINMIPESIIFMIIFILLRTYAGGVHMEKFISCLLCSVVVQSSVLLLNRYYQFSIIQAWVIIVCCSGVIIWLSPVDNINRMLEDIEKIYFQRKTQNIVLGILLFSGICTLIRLDGYISLIAEIMIVVVISQYIGKIKYKLEKEQKRQE